MHRLSDSGFRMAKPGSGHECILNIRNILHYDYGIIISMTMINIYFTSKGLWGFGVNISDI